MSTCFKKKGKIKDYREKKQFTKTGSKLGSRSFDDDRRNTVKVKRILGIKLRKKNRKVWKKGGGGIAPE